MLKSLFSILLVIFSFSCFGQSSTIKPVTGQKEYKSFIKKHIDYPRTDIKSKTQGTVIIEFSTDKMGNVTNYSIIQKVSRTIDSAAVSLFRMVLWEPTIVDGKPSKGKSEIDIKYNLKSFNKLTKRRGYVHIEFPYTPIDTSVIIYSLKQLDTPPVATLEKRYRSLGEYIYNNISYPEAASKLALEGDVELMFIIETNGLPSNIVATKHLGGGCTEEAIRIVETINWLPGIIDSTAVRTKYNMKIVFKKGESKDTHIPNQQGSGI